MAVIQPYFQPTPDTSMPVFASFWNGFMQERSMMNMMLMRQFFNKASPEFLDAHIEQTNQRIKDLEDQRLEMAKLNKIEGGKFLMGYLQEQAKYKSGARRSGYRGGVSAKTLLQERGKLQTAIINQRGKSNYDASVAEKQALRGRINTSMSQSPYGFTDDFMRGVLKKESVGFDAPQLPADPSKWKTGDFIDSVIEPLADKALGKGSFKKLKEDDKDVVTAEIMGNVLENISLRSGGNTTGTFGKKSGKEAENWFKDMSETAKEAAKDGNYSGDDHAKLAAAVKLMRGRMGETYNTQLSDYLAGPEKSGDTLSANAKENARVFKARNDSLVNIDYATREKANAQLLANFPDFVKLFQAENLRDQAKAVHESNQSAVEYITQDSLDQTTGEPLNRFGMVIDQEMLNAYDSESLSKNIQASEKALKRAQAEVDDVELILKGRFEKGTKGVPFDKKFKDIIRASAAIDPQIYAKLRNLKEVPDDPFIKDIDEKLKQQEELLSSLRFRREKIYDQMLRGPQSFFKGFKSNYLLETPFKKPSRAAEVSQKFIDSNMRQMTTPTGTRSKAYPGLETGKEYRLASGMWVGVTPNEQPFYKVSAGGSPQVVSTDSNDYDQFTRVLTKLNKQIAALPSVGE